MSNRHAHVHASGSHSSGEGVLRRSFEVVSSGGDLRSTFQGTRSSFQGSDMHSSFLEHRSVSEERSWQDLAAVREERKELLGYIESLTTALKKVETENDVCKRQLEETREENGRLSRSLDLSRAEVEGLSSQLRIRGQSQRENELASALKIAEEQRTLLSEKVKVMEFEIGIQKQTASEHKQALDHLSQTNGNSDRNGANTTDTLKRNKQLSLQLEVAQKEAREAHKQLLKLRAELKAFQDEKVAAREPSDTRPVTVNHRTAQRAGVPEASDHDQPVVIQHKRVAQRAALPEPEDSPGQKVDVTALERALAQLRAELRQTKGTLSAREAEITVLKSAHGATSDGKQLAELTGYVTELRAKLDQAQGEVNNLSSELCEKENLIEEQQRKIQRCETSLSGGGNIRQIAELKDQVQQLQNDLSRANKELQDQAQDLEAIRGGSGKEVQEFMQRITNLQGELAAAQHELETRMAPPPPEVKKEMVLNLQELEPLLPKRLPVSTRPPHPLQFFEAPVRTVSPSGAIPIHAVASEVAPLTSEQEMTELSVQIQTLQGKEAQLKRQIDAIHKKAAQARSAQSSQPRMLNGMLTVTIHGVQNVPKQDMFGHADPYCSVQMMQTTEKTRKLKNTANPEFEETFEFPLQQVPIGQLVLITLMEWNRMGRNKAVGTLEVPMQTIVECDGISRQNVQLQSTKSGALTGPNHQPCMILYSARYISSDPPPRIELSSNDQLAVSTASRELSDIRQEITNTEARLSALEMRDGGMKGQGATNSWELRLCLIRANHLPKMDWTGMADPYVTFDMEGHERKRSKTISNCLDPEWKEDFVFNVKDNTGELVLAIWDFDKMSRDELIGEVRLKLADLSGACMTTTRDILRRGTVKNVIGKDGEKSVITFSLFASNSLAHPSTLSGQGPGSASRPRQADPTVPLTVSLKFDAPWDQLCATAQDQLSFRNSLVNEFAHSLGVESERFVILKLQKGSIIVDMNILPDTDFASKKSPEYLAITMMEQVAMMHSGNQSRLTKIVACQIQNRKVQLEAENAFLIEQNGMLKAALIQIDKTNKLKASEKASRVLYRWMNRAIALNFQTWKYLTVTAADRRKVQEVHDKELRDLNKELDNTKRQLGENNGYVQDQLEMLKETRQLVLEDAGKQQMAAREAIEKAENDAAEARASAKELAKKHYELEARLHKKLIDMKVKGGGPRLKIHVHNAKKLPKVDTFGWIDAYLVITLAEETYKTKIIHKTENPAWNEDFEFPVTGLTDALHIDLFDWELVSSPRAVGKIVINMAEVVDQKSVDKIYEFRTVDGSALQGKNAEISTLHLTLSYEEKSDAELKALQEEMKELEQKEREKDTEIASAEQKIKESGKSLSIKPPFTLKVHIKGLRHLPFMDKCDTYVVLECAGQRQQTNKVNDSSSPDFDETMEFSIGKSTASISIKAMAWRSNGDDREIGVFQLPVGRPLAGTVEHELQLTDPKTQGHLVGNDRQTTTVLLSLTADPVLHPDMIANVMSFSTRGASVPWKLKINLYRASSLPKMDALGKCDAYVILSVNGNRKSSKTIKNTYAPQWDEEFEFDVIDDEDEFVATVWDWDLGTSDDKVGSIHTPLSLFKDSGEGVEKSFNLTRDGQVVKGHDGKPTTIFMQFWAMKITEIALDKGVDGIAEDSHGHPQEAKVQCQPVHGVLTVTARSARGLPKMDAWTGRADPYLVMSVDGMKQRTECKKNTLEPEWNETFQFRCVANKSEMVVSMFDYESIGSDRPMGLFYVPVRNLTSYDTETYTLSGVMDDGHPACGKVYLKLSFAAASHDDTDVHNWDASESGVWVKVKAANNLPKMGLLGTCNPLVSLEIDGQTHETDHQPDCYDAKFVERPFHFPHAGSDSVLLVTINNFNKSSGIKMIGKCVIDLSNADKDGIIEGTFNVLHADGTPVQGHSKEECTVSLSIKTNPLTDGQADLDGIDVGSDVWNFSVKALSFDHMPKMDVTGTCDAYLQLSVQGDERRTKDISGYKGEWNEEFLWESVSGHRSNLVITCFDKDTFDKDDYIGSCTIPLSSIINREKGKRIHLLSNGSVVVGKDGKPTEILLYLKGEHAESMASSASSLVAGINTQDYSRSLEELCSGLRSQVWTIDVILISLQRISSNSKPFVKLSLSGSGSEKHVQKSSKATTKSFTWNHSNNFTFSLIDDDLNSAIHVALMDSGFMGNKAIGSLSVPVQDILLFHLAQEDSGLAGGEVDMEIKEIQSEKPLKDEYGFKTKIKLRFAVSLPQETISRELTFGQQPNTTPSLQALLTSVDNYILTETKWQEWVSGVRDAEAGNIFSQLDQIEGGDSEGADAELLEVSAIREKLQSARGEVFTSSQVEIFLGILTTLAQLILLKILMLDTFIH